MKYGIIGTGMVGETLASKLVSMGHDVMMGSRTADNPKAIAWRDKSGARASTGTFRDTAHFAEVLMSCTTGATSLEALASVDPADLAGKILIDVSNPLDFSKGMPPTLSVVNDDSLGERMQRQCPQARVVKALNTVNCQVMVNPALVGADSDLFICGNDAAAKDTVKALVSEWGWKSIIDMGDITNARATEQLMPIWIRLFAMYKSPVFNFKIVKP